MTDAIIEVQVEGPQGPPGAAGSSGPQGPAGAQGPAGTVDYLVPVVQRMGTSYTLQSGDLGSLLILANVAAVTLTLPASLPVGWNCVVIQGDAGPIGFVPEAGASLVEINGNNHSAGLNATCSLIVRSNAGGIAAQWHLSGDTDV